MYPFPSTSRQGPEAGGIRSDNTKLPIHHRFAWLPAPLSCDRKQHTTRRYATGRGPDAPTAPGAVPSARHAPPPDSPQRRFPGPAYRNPTGNSRRGCAGHHRLYRNRRRIARVLPLRTTVWRPPAIRNERRPATQGGGEFLAFTFQQLAPAKAAGAPVGRPLAAAFLHPTACRLCRLSDLFNRLKKE
jgi:hypothetical protein